MGYDETYCIIINQILNVFFPLFVFLETNKQQQNRRAQTHPEHGGVSLWQLTCRTGRNTKWTLAGAVFELEVDCCLSATASPSIAWGQWVCGFLIPRNEYGKWDAPWHYLTVNKTTLGKVNLNLAIFSPPITSNCPTQFQHSLNIGMPPKEKFQVRISGNFIFCILPGLSESKDI